MRQLMISKSFIAFGAVALLAAGTAHGQTTPPATAPTTVGGGQPSTPTPPGNKPAPARPRVKPTNNFLPVLGPLAGLAAAGAVAATSGGGNGTPASPQ